MWLCFALVATRAAPTPPLKVSEPTIPATVPLTYVAHFVLDKVVIMAGQSNMVGHGYAEGSILHWNASSASQVPTLCSLFVN